MALNSSRQWIPLQKQLVPKAKEDSTVYQMNIERRHKETIDAALKRGYLKLLDQELILQSQKDSEGHDAASELQDVHRISLSNAHVQALDDIAVLSCTKLRICNLGSCYLRNISAFYGSINLLKLDVSNNQICQLPRNDFWSSLSSLRVLYLHGNGLSGREALSRLNACRSLHILTLHDTPLALINNYRHHVVNSILSLRALDSNVISDEEIIENLHLSGSFKPLTKHFTQQLYVSPQKGMSYVKELQAVYHTLLTVNRVLARHSPVIFLQRCIRGWLVRKALAKSNNPRIRSLVTRTRTSISVRSQQLKSKDTSLQTGLVISAEIPLSKRPKDPVKGKTKLKSLPPPPPSSPFRRTTPNPVETHMIGIDGNSSRAKYFMHINLRKLQQTISEAEALEPEGVDKHFRSAFRKKPWKAVATNPEPSVRESKDAEKADESTLTCTTLPDPTVEGFSVEADEVQVTGAPAAILAHDQKPDWNDIKKKGGSEIREAEKEILQVVTKLKEPLKIQNKPSNSAKDELLFTRATATMALSTLCSVEQQQLANKKSDTLKQKMNLVEKIKQDRVTRKAKIEKFHKKVRDQVRDWKSDEDHRLEDQRTKLREKRNSTLLKQSEEYDVSTQRRFEQRKDQNHAFEFGVQNTMVGSTLLKEDYKSKKETEATEKRDVVREAREQATEKQEMVKRFMELRRIKLLQEGEEARKKLDSKMLEAASNRLIASKRKIDRETARKQAAREAIALAKEELRRGPHRPGEAMPADQGPPVVTDSEAAHVQFSPNRANTEFKNPSHMRRMSRDAHSTWQRGSRVVSATEEGHFPLIRTTSETPLMYGMLQPGTKRTRDLPVIADSETPSSATSSMIITKPLSVR